MPRKLPIKYKERDWSVSAAKFLRRIWLAHEKGYVCIAVRNSVTGKWNEVFLPTGASSSRIQQSLEGYDPKAWDIYYCPNAFSEKKRKAKYGLRTRYAWADCDAYHPNGYKPEPSIIVETSKASYQALWLFDIALKAPVAEAYSNKFVCDFGGDKGGHSVTKLLRVPATRNNKPERNGDLVNLLKSDLSPIPRPKVWMLEISASLPRGSRKRRTRGTTSLSAQKIIAKYGRYVPPSILVLAAAEDISPKWPDRSKAIYLLVTAFHNARAKPAELVKLLLSNPYFVNKHGSNADTAWDEVNRIISKRGGQNG
ncbi:DNA-primase RepB domain-containing protein [Sulfitobacter sp. HGT1]|uniref:DNA-primase RepB domain-containing protein n=1 Tax=Sulfitobacter sp. HGT1 TaxID=2735435 RepID=UPI0015931312|nr:DNA-primase RepB domain-containing protein [Sulfitobacter sp. HGT1]